MRRLLLVTHRSIEQAGGPAARWRAFARYLPEHGWEVDVLSATEHTGAVEFDAHASRAVSTRAAAMAKLARLSEPAFHLAGVRPDSLPLSMLWVARGALRVRRWIERRAPDVVLASGPPIAGPIAARAGVRARVPLVIELRDLWAGNPAFDAGGRTLSRIEDWLLREARAVIACTPEAVHDLRVRHPDSERRIVEIPNGFDPRLRSIAARNLDGDVETAARSLDDDVELAAGSRRALTLIHSGTLTPARPIAPLVQALGDRQVVGSFRLILHGYLSPTSLAEVQRAKQSGGVSIDVLPPSGWEEAVGRIARADVGVITQSRAAGDETAIASKVYEYLALSKPVLCVSDGGASEALLRRMGAGELCARLDEPETIVAALVRLRDGALGLPSPARLEPYSRRALAATMAALLEEVASGG